MPFDPALQARIDAHRGRTAPDGDDEASRLRRLISKRENVPGYAANVRELRQRLSELSGGSTEDSE